MKAAILQEIGAPLAVDDIDLPKEVKRGQVLVRILCAGICGSQLQEIDGIKGNPEHLPHLLGHEGCGIVLATGAGVTTVKEGDKVVMHWRKGDGIEAAPATYGEIKAGPITTFSEYAVVSENRVTAIPQDVPNDYAALLGCALSTALAIVENECDIQRANVVVVVGCGGLGLSLILCAVMRSLFVTGIDVARSKREIVESFGAKYWSRNLNHYAPDLVLDTIGQYRGKTPRQYISLQNGGTQGGGFNPVKDIPRYTEMWRDGNLNGYEKLITHRISLDQINEGIQLMRDGKAGRVMIKL